MAKTLHFKTNTLLKNLVGKDLINDDNIAIVELVKNSYDAKSKEVLIKFEDSNLEIKEENSPRIVIADKGVGMTEGDIREKWLNIAYSEKKVDNTKKGDYFAGNKGIGRFSCDRLGSALDMFTRTRGGDLCHLKIDWTDFEKEGNKDLTIQKIGVKLNITDNESIKRDFGLKMPNFGTILIISNLRANWDREKLIDLKRSLEKFINPNQLFLRNKFEIKIEAESQRDKDSDSEYHDQVNGTVKNLIFEQLKFNTTYIESSVSPDGDHVEFKLHHDGNPVFRVKERSLNYKNLKGVSLVVYYLNPYKKSYFKRQTGVRSVDFGSIFLFLNGFRVAPYGERGDDWLGLDVRKTQGTTRYLSNRDVVGRIEIIDSEERFKPISSREGLKLTSEFINLKEKYFFDAFRRLERFVVDGLDWDSVPEAIRKTLPHSDGLSWEETDEKYVESWDRKRKRISKAIMTLIGVPRDRVIDLWFNSSLLDDLVAQKSKDLQVIIDDIESFDGEAVDDDLKENLKKIGKIISEKNKEVKLAKREVAGLKVEAEENKKIIHNLEKVTDEYRAQTLFLKSVSTLDEKRLLGFHHQICLDSSIIDNYIGKAVKALRDKEDIRSALVSIEKISRANKKIMATAQYATKANFKSGAKREITDLPAFIEQYLDNVTRDFASSGLRLTINNRVPEAFEVKAKRIELSILIDNLISNANKAHAKSLVVTMSLKDKNHLTVSFVDDGNGLDDSVSLSDVFDLGVTSTSGSGLGLFHSKEIVESLDGDIELIPGKEKGVQIRMIFTR